MNFCAGVLDRETRRFYLDLGNALPTGTAGALNDLGDLSLSAQWTGGTAPIRLGVLPSSAYTQPSWYPATAGVAVFPPDRPLTEEDRGRCSGPLALTVPGGPAKAAGIRSRSGLFVRADQFVFRLSPGDKQVGPTVRHPVRAAVAGRAVATAWTPGYLQMQAEGPEGSPPAVTRHPGRRDPL